MPSFSPGFRGIFIRSVIRQSSFIGRGSFITFSYRSLRISVRRCRCLSFAKSHNLNPLAIGMIWTFAAGGKIFMYQSPVLVVGYSYGQFEAKDLFTVGLILTVIDFFILMLLVPTLWPMIGIR